MSLIFAIDSYLSTQERADTCKNLISSIKETYPDKKILLVNKFRESWGLDKLVDFYYFHGSGFLLGHPPASILNSGKYERPYTYMHIGTGTFENWFPLVNVSDHAADVFNSFILTASIAKTLGYEKVYKIEYDTILDRDEFLSMENDMNSFRDYLLYGVRKEGVWAKDHQYLIDVHNIGYSVNLFDGFDILKNDEDYWKLCEKINYYGKWIEYVIPAAIEYQRKTKDLQGIEYTKRVDLMYPKTKFDAINSPGIWANTWQEIPKICRVSLKSKDEHARPNELVVFYVAHLSYVKEKPIHTHCRITSVNSGQVIYERELDIQPGAWMFDQLYIYEPVNVYIKNDHGFEKEMTYSPDMFDKIDPRFVFNS